MFWYGVLTGVVSTVLLAILFLYGLRKGLVQLISDAIGRLLGL